MAENIEVDQDTFRADVTTVRNDAQHRYELLVGGKVAVQAYFVDLPGHIDFTHTESADEFRGRGYAGVLAHFALDDVVASGKRIIPHCPFISGYLRKHVGYEQYVDWP